MIALKDTQYDLLNSKESLVEAGLYNESDMQITFKHYKDFKSLIDLNQSSEEINIDKLDLSKGNLLKDMQITLQETLKFIPPAIHLSDSGSP